MSLFQPRKLIDKEKDRKESNKYAARRVRHKKKMLIQTLSNNIQQLQVQKQLYDQEEARLLAEQKMLSIQFAQLTSLLICRSALSIVPELEEIHNRPPHIFEFDEQFEELVL